MPHPRLSSSGWATKTSVDRSNSSIATKYKALSELVEKGKPESESAGENAYSTRQLNCLQSLWSSLVTADVVLPGITDTHHLFEGYGRPLHISVGNP